jgi:hypothetical protein
MSSYLVRNGTTPTTIFYSDVDPYFRLRDNNPHQLFVHVADVATLKKFIATYPESKNA